MEKVKWMWWQLTDRERQEVFSDQNRYYAALALGRPADDHELIAHYFEYAGSRVKIHVIDVHPQEIVEQMRQVA